MAAGVRNLSFTYADDLSPAQRPNGYKGSLVPSILVTGELYPLALGGGRGLLAGLGVGFVFDRVLSIKSKLGMTEYDTAQMRYGGGLRWRINLGDKPTSPTVKLIAGINRLHFTIAHGTDSIDLPDVAYTYIDAGGAVRVPLGTPMVALYADVRYLQVLDSGEISEIKAYGGGSVLGLDAEAGLALTFARFAVKVGAHYERIAFSFDGTGALTERDGNIRNQDVGGALDQYFSGYVTAGYLF
jgi:hypothetical protein